MTDAERKLLIITAEICQTLAVHVKDDMSVFSRKQMTELDDCIRNVYMEGNVKE